MKSKQPAFLPPSPYVPFLRRFTDERAADLADIQALYQKVTHSFEASNWAKANIIEQVSSFIADAVVKLVVVPSAPIAHQLDRCQQAILAMEITLFRRAIINNGSS